MPYFEENQIVRVLPNGLRVAFDPLPYVRSVSAGVWILAGSANETAMQSGISHFLEHLFFKGTATRSAHQLMAAVEGRGGHINAFTGRDCTCIYVKVLDTQLRTGIEILADIIKNSQFQDLDKERNVILEEIASSEDIPEDFAHDLFAQRLWPGHPMGLPVTGTVEAVNRIGLEDIHAYYTQRYRPQGMVISIAGRFDIEETYQLLADEFGEMTAVPIPDSPAPPQWGAGVEQVERDVGQSHLCFGFPGPTVNDPRRYVYDMLSSVLGGGSTSRLFEQIREEAGLAYSIYTFHSCHVLSGTLGVYAAVAPENLHKTLELAFRELRDVRDRPLGEEELLTNQEQINGNVLMSLESTFGRMTRLAKGLLYRNRIIPVDEVLEAVNAVSANDIQGLAQELFSQEKCTMVVLGPGNGRIPLEYAL
jgi:predicted Zn-dependent peptidase